MLYCVLTCALLCFFFFKQKTPYEMRFSDWSSDECSSDLGTLAGPHAGRHSQIRCRERAWCHGLTRGPPRARCRSARPRRDRQSVVEGKSVSVSVDPGGGRIRNKKMQ